MQFLKSLFVNENEKAINKIRNTVNSINSLESSYSALSDSELKEKTRWLKERLKKGESIDDILGDAFALVREASKRTLEQRHFDVQLIGGIVLNQGNIAEMKTGEGKTLVATCPAYLNALKEEGVHIITVNDYLARRDAVWMGQIYNALGLTVGVINDRQAFMYDPEHKEKDAERDELGSFKVIYDFLRPATRKEAYDADITYGTNNQFAFDYLRDNTAYSEKNVVQRGFNFAIVDEIDSILIDEARQPLIISTPSEEQESFYQKFAEIAKRLHKEEDYTTDEKRRAISITSSGIEKAEKALGIENLYSSEGSRYIHYLQNAITAEALFHKNKEYVVKDNEIIIVDEFTGRLQPGRRWSNKLHQAIEAKEGVAIKQESRTVASITYQNYFRSYKRLSGMTGTAKTSSEEFYKVYGLSVIEIPTNKPVTRIDNEDLIYEDEGSKIQAIAEQVKELNKKGQPVLIGTTSIEKNEELSEHLQKKGIEHLLLNAKNHEKEGEIIAQAGKKGAVTIATNLAGRGVDIKLGGIPFEETKAEEVKKLGGLFVLGTERHEARRIDNQLRGRSGRQGDPGETRFFVSLEDQIMRIFGGDRIKSLMQTMKFPKGEALENKMISRSLESAQRKIEGHHFDARRFVLDYDQVLNKHRSIVYKERRSILLGGGEEFIEFIKKYAFSEEFKEKFEEKKKGWGDDFEMTMKQIMLRGIDIAWIKHLEVMDYARSSVGLRSYGQKEPLIEYKNEASRLFSQFWDEVSSVIEKLLENQKEAIKE